MIEAKRLFEIPHNQLKNHPNDKMFVTKTDGEWIGVSTKQFLDDAMEISKGLIITRVCSDVPSRLVSK